MTELEAGGVPGDVSYCAMGLFPFGATLKIHNGHSRSIVVSGREYGTLYYIDIYEVMNVEERQRWDLQVWLLLTRPCLLSVPL